MLESIHKCLIIQSNCIISRVIIIASFFITYVMTPTCFWSCICFSLPTLAVTSYSKLQRAVSLYSAFINLFMQYND